MPDISEFVLHYIWKHQLLTSPLTTASGLPLAVEFPGHHNRNAGPDFSGALVRLNGTLLAGNVEIHLRTSDWLRHGHQRDQAYDRLLLHAVWEHDFNLDQNRDNNVEVLRLSDFVNPETLTLFGPTALSDSVPCSRQIASVDADVLHSWVGSMSAARLENKADRVLQIFRACDNDYAQTMYVLLLRAFGSPVNADPFEQLARLVPVHLLLRQDNIIQATSLVLGAAGLLNEKDGAPPYWQEWEYRSRLHGIDSLDPASIKRSRMRPRSFPALRLQQATALLYKQPALMTQPWKFLHRQEIHKKIGTTYCDAACTAPGAALTDLLIINAIVPFVIFYARRQAVPSLETSAIELLRETPAEKNYKTRMFGRRLAKNAFESQGLLYLFDHWCTCRKCLSCGVGRAITNPSPRCVRPIA